MSACVFVGLFARLMVFCLLTCLLVRLLLFEVACLPGLCLCVLVCVRVSGCFLCVRVCVCVCVCVCVFVCLRVVSACLIDWLIRLVGLLFGSVVYLVCRLFEHVCFFRLLQLLVWLADCRLA